MTTCSLRPCRRQGIGTPPLCEECRALLFPAPQRPAFDPATDPVAAVLDQLLQNPATAEAFSNIADRASDYVGNLDEFVRRIFVRTPGDRGRPAPPRSRDTRQDHRTPPPGRGATPPPGKSPIRAARELMGFGDYEHIDKTILKKRYRELAMKHHPDRGGDVKRMALINKANDLLAAQLGG